MFSESYGATDKGIGKIILETDCLMLKPALESGAYRFSEVGGYHW
jgi:hypothetical protein